MKYSNSKPLLQLGSSQFLLHRNKPNILKDYLIMDLELSKVKFICFYIQTFYFSVVKVRFITFLSFL